MLGDCLRSLQAFVEEICVVDTGSCDGTIELARSFGARVEHFAWCDDFSAARNRSLEMATHEWIFVIDADEELTAESGTALREALTQEGELAFLVMRDDLHSDGRRESIPLPRLIRNDPRIRFDLPVHESVMNSLFAIGCPSPRPVPVRLRHKGYLPEVLRRVDKAARNLAILRTAVQAHSPNPFMHWKLAQTLSQPQHHTERLSALAEVLRLTEAMSLAERSELTFLPRAYDAFANDLCHGGLIGEAIRTADQGLELFPNSAELLYRRADLALRAGDFTRADTLFLACVEATSLPVMFPRAPELANLWPSIGRARSAFGMGSDVAGLERLRAVLATSPNDVEARCLWVSRRFASSDFQGALKVFGSLVGKIAESSLVKTLAGDAAWLQRDTRSARDFWLLAGDCSAIGFDVAARLALTTWVMNPAASIAAIPRFPVRDTTSAACALILAAVSGTTPQIEDAFQREAIVKAVRWWVDQYVLSFGTQAHGELQRLAPRLEDDFPGVVRAVG